MYRHSYHYPWYNPKHQGWNNSNGGYTPYPYYDNWVHYNWNPCYEHHKDYGSKPLVIKIDQAAKLNHTYRTALWTGKYLQVTLMSIPVGDDVGLEVHPTTDQFIRIEEGQGLVQMGDSKDKLDFQEMAYDDYAIMIPAGKWHNVINMGHTPLKIYVIYAPPEHPYGTVHETKSIAMAATVADT